MKNSGVYKWHKRFKKCCENVEDERGDCPRSYRTDDNVEKVKTLVHSGSQPSLLCGNIEPVPRICVQKKA
jgi:hypothetical protein